ncbi:MAG: PD40 domain-containing protein [Myxococcales bacterium]|nr:PD40 domain-containing protein [Myxococcales bacterium]
MTHRLLVSALAWWALTFTGVARAGDPDRQWRTVETAHFVIHYPVPLDAIARRVGVVAERAHDTLAPALRHAPAGKTLVVVNDDTDGANGFANVAPRNAITLFATAPHGSSALADHDDWLYSLVTHEYTHVLHLDTMSGLPLFYNAIFGKIWAPNQIMPRWIIEGIATYEESKRGAGGRTRQTEFDGLLRSAVLANRPLRLDQVTGAPRLYPRGNIAYLHGSAFLRYVFDRFGDDKLAAMSHAQGAYPVPFALSRQAMEAVGRSFPELFDDWMLHLRDRYALQEQAVSRRGARTGRPLTDGGELNWRPLYAPDGKWLWWLSGNGREVTSLRKMPVGGDASQAVEVLHLDALGHYDLARDGALVFEQSRSYQDQFQVQDLFLRSAAGGPPAQVTRRQRARDPAVSPDGRRVAYSQNLASTSVLTVSPLVPMGEPHTPVAAQVVWRGRPFEQAYQPAWSPDGAQLAFSAWRAGGWRDILLVELASGKVTEVTSDRALDGSPVFSPDGRWLYFDSDRTGISNLLAYDLRSRELWQVTEVLGGAYQPTVSPDGTRLAYRVLSDRGYDLHELMVAPPSWRRAPPYLDDRPAPVVVDDREAEVSAPRPYRALETLAPQTWSYEVLSTAKGSYTTVRTSGGDAVGLHGYSLATGLVLPRADLNVAGSYGYNGWVVPVRMSGGRTAAERSGFRVDGLGRSYREEVWSGSLALGLPGQRRPGASWFLSFDYAMDYSRLLEKPDDSPDPNDRLPRRPLTNTLQAGLGVRMSYSALDSTVQGIGPQQGGDVSVGLRLDLPELGATYRAITASYTGRWYQQLPGGGRGPTLALRVAGAIRGGDLVRTGSYSLGGLPPGDLVSAVLNSTRASTVGTLRGYPARAVAGNQFHLLGAELRQLLWNVERGLQTLPVYAQRLHVAALLDAAAAWDGDPTADSVRTSVGAALRLDLVLGFFEAGTLEVGVARGLGDKGLTETWMLLTGAL